MSELTGRVVLVTGATGGIGAATVRAAAAAGAVPVLAHYCEAEQAAELATELQELVGGQPVLTVEVDVRDSAQVGDMVETVLARHGRIDVLVNNAGLMEETAFTEMTEEDWARTIDTDLTGVFRVTRQVVPTMQAAGAGVIVSVASQLAAKGAAGYTAYCAAKAGVIGLTRALAREVGPTVRVCAIAPGPVRTPMIEPYLTPGWVAERAGSLVAGRLATPQEVAAAILALAGDAGALMHGQTLHANGGGVLA